MRIGSLFSGVGGLDMAVQDVFGGRHAWFSEIDPPASKVLAYRFPGVPNLGDITKIDWQTVEPVDVLCGGFPCQDVSAAGKRAGIKHGTRSGLWSVFADAIDALRPRWVVIENVRGLLSATAQRTVEDGDSLESAAGVVGDGTGRPVLRAAGAVLGDLADLGYDAQWATVAAADVGAPHRRERVFILAADASRNGCGGGAERNLKQATQLATSQRHDADRRVLADGRDIGRPGAADSPRDGWGEGRPESARLVGGFDAAVSGDEPGVALLPTPSTHDKTGARSPESIARMDKAFANLNDTAVNELSGVALLPTPNASDGTGGGQHPDKQEGHSRQLIDYVFLLQTPQARDGKGLPGKGFNKGNLLSQVIEKEEKCCHPADARMITDSAIGCGVCLSHLDVEDAARSYGTQWGKYEPAIRRWEAVTGQPAPPPTEPNKNGNPRLAAEFSSWLMGWPAGWVTDPAIGISRNDQLRCVGNGVVSLQAAAAIRYLMEVRA